MFWKYTRTETKQALTVTLLLFATCALLVGQNWTAITENERLAANTVGVYVGVEENGVNTLAAELDARERELDAREMALLQNEMTFTSDKRVLVFLVLTGTGLLGLILMNFYLDHKRRRSLTS